MGNIDDRISAIKIKLAEKSRLERKLAEMNSQIKELKNMKEGLYKKLKKEELDVEKLEGISFANFYHSIVGDKADILEKEKQEALAAKLKYDSHVKEIEMLDKDISRTKRKIDELEAVEKEYNLLLEEKERSILESNSEISIKLNKVINEETNIMDKNKEIKEAIDAGYVLLNSLDKVKENLDSAGAWGTWDILGGGMISTMAKHSRLNAARNEITMAQSHLRRFHRELKDIGSSINLEIEIGSFLTFADYFFDGLFADLTVQRRINDYKMRVASTINDVINLINKLKYELKNNNERLTNLEKDKKDIIENIKLD